MKEPVPDLAVPLRSGRSAIRPRCRTPWSRRTWPIAASCRLRALALLIACTALASDPLNAATIQVACSGTDLVSAVAQANDESLYPGGDTIVLQAGCTYMLLSRFTPTSNHAFPTITSDLIILGNGATIEHGPPESTESFGFFGVATSGSLLLSNVTLANGSGSNGGFLSNGGAMTLLNSTVVDDGFGNNDSAIRNHIGGNLNIIDSTIMRCVLPREGTGGALHNTGSVVIVRSTFSNNRVVRLLAGPGAYNGGAIANLGKAEIFDSTFTGNFAAVVGGAITNSGDLRIYGTSFVANSSGNFGGVIYNAQDLVVEGSYFDSNRTNIDGGALYSTASSLAQITNSTFYDNRAGSNGGAVSNGHAMRIRHSTFLANSAEDGGGTLHGSGGLISLERSVIDGNAPCLGAITDFGENIVYPLNTNCPTTFETADPKLGVPGLYGGRTKTSALGAGSAAVDRIASAGCLQYDQRGFLRPAGALCDIGALEDRIPSVPGTPVVSSGGNPNRGTFQLGWTASTDAEGQPLKYRLYHRDADDASFTLAGTLSGNLYTSPSAGEAEGTFVYQVDASDGNHFSALSAVSSAVIVDRSAPSAPAATADRQADFTNSETAWYRDSVTVTFGGSVDPPLQDGSIGSGVASITAPQAFAVSGQHTAAGSATDRAGNESAQASLVVHVDADNPVVAFVDCPSDVILHAPATTDWAASDAHSGLNSSPSGQIVLDTSSIATRSVVASATDNVGHTAAATCTYRVIYDFQGFLSPLRGTDGHTEWTAGDDVPVSFTLGGDQGLGVFAPGYPQSAEIACGGLEPLESGDATESARGLTYSRGNERYKYGWQTSPQWAGTCRQLIVKLVDGTYHRANFQFTE